MFRAILCSSLGAQEYNLQQVMLRPQCGSTYCVFGVKDRTTSCTPNTQSVLPHSRHPTDNNLGSLYHMLHVARMGEEWGVCMFCWGNRREGDQWGDIGVDGWIILGWISRRWDVGIWTGLGWPRIETVGGRL